MQPRFVGPHVGGNAEEPSQTSCKCRPSNFRSEYSVIFARETCSPYVTRAFRMSLTAFAAMASCVSFSSFDSFRVGPASLAALVDERRHLLKSLALRL